jgi:hypothetical protein
VVTIAVNIAILDVTASPFQYIKILFTNRKIKAIFDYTVGAILIGLSLNLLSTV